MNTKFTLKKIFLFTLIFCTTPFWSQELVKVFGGTGTDSVTRTIETNDGGYLLLGTSESTNGDITDINNGDFDLIVYKVSSNGSIEWQKNYGGNGFDSGEEILSTPDGGYVILGLTDSNNNGDVPLTKGSLDIWVLKINAQGDILWSKTFGGNGYDEAGAMIINADNTFSIVGLTESSNFLNSNNSSTKFFYLKINATATTILPSSNSFKLNGLGGELNTIVTSSDGGYFAGGAVYDGDLSKPVVFKIYSDGTIQWNTIIPINVLYDQNLVTDCKILADGSFLICGEIFSNEILAAKGFMAKLNSTGSIAWQNEYFNGSSTLSGITQNSNQEIWTIGTTIKNGTNGAFSTGDALGWLLKIDPTNGAVLIDYNFGGLNDNTYTATWYSLINSEGKIVITGSTPSNTGTFQGLSNSGSSDDGYLLKIDPTTLNIIENKSNISLKIYPNPVNNTLHIENTDGIIIEKITILDPLGKIILQKNNSFDTINVENINTGLYFLQITTKTNQVITEKFLKQ